jgi:hypothetical protein
MSMLVNSLGPTASLYWLRASCETFDILEGSVKAAIADLSVLDELRR